MTTLNNVSTIPAIEPTEPVDASLRLRLRDRGSGLVAGSVDGGWWPRTRDLSMELPSLLAGMQLAGFDVRRVTYNLAAWDDAPRRLIVAGQLVRLGGYNTQNASTIALIDPSGWNSRLLVVVPPSADPTIAERVFAMAGRAGDRRTAAEILEQADRVPPPRLSSTGCLDDLPSSA